MPKMRKKDRDNVLRMIDQGYINEEISEKTGVSLPTIRAIRKENEVQKGKSIILFNQVKAFDDTGIVDEGEQAVTLRNELDIIDSRFERYRSKIEAIEKFLKQYGYKN